MNHFMLDLETLGSTVGSVILSIGACKFDPLQIGVRGPYFHETIRVKTSLAARLTIDGDTLKWWLGQSEEARNAAFKGESSLTEALEHFNSWLCEFGEAKELAVWGNGATFDNVLLRAAYAAAKLKPAWHFRGDKCYRTVINLLPEPRRPAWERIGTHHNALDDAITQAVYLQRVYKELGLA